MARTMDGLSNGLRRISLENDLLAVEILPEVGAKILTVLDKRTGRNLLWENPRIRPQRYPIDANFDNYWCGGWDDVFPTADACVYHGEPYPNVGELRSLQWDVGELDADDSKAVVKLSTYGPINAIKASKTISLVGSAVSMRFEIESLSPLPIDFLWGTHPAFAVKTGTRLILPARTGIVMQSSDASLGKPGDTYAWPIVGETDMSVVQDISAGVACGHIATDLEDGWFAIDHGGSGVVYEFPLEACPHLWLWLVYGGWRGYHLAIVEPWTGYPVNLSQAVEAGRHRQLEPMGRFDVTVSCTPYLAPETPASALARLRSL